ncbi:nuclear pore complex protein DDB_G0274915-like [Formica exsecta]|uniref:nuclear pore complex protein DDB_G0274915-like n=1 Tax=Formica exsecta TaxID=72781 RepID=UPI00114239C7|nr:nuclear pore complex protein DDB_G0274915-like [Formica exsecta]
MTTEIPKVEFALGSEVSPGRFFKSAFARNFISSGRDCKSLDYELLDNAVVNQRDDRNNNTRNNNFFSLVTFADDKPINDGGNDAAVLWEQPKPKNQAAQSAADANELEKLRKQCQLLKKENRRLQSAFLQNVFLQARVDTLQWQVKQVESNRQMYRSTMEQVAHFLGRVHRSLEILHSKENSKDKRRVPRSRSVHTVVHADPSPNRSTATPSSSSSTSSPFTRAKSVTQISSPSAVCFREFTWSVLRRNDPVHCTSPRAKPPQDLNKTNDPVPDNVVYREPKQTEMNPDEIPPEKLSQEAFRLLRTVESLLAMREPDLARVTPIEDNGSSPSPTVDHRHHDTSLSLPSGNFANSTMLQEAAYIPDSGHGNESISSGQQDDSRSTSLIKPSVTEFTRSFVPGVRRSPDTASWNSSSSKTTEEEDTVALITPSNGITSNSTPTSTLTRTAKRLEKKESNQGNSNPGKTKVKPASSPVSSAEGESGFFSISSFQEVGLPPSTAAPITPVKGCHTEVGLPEVPLDKARHRRWSSTPAEIQALFKQHRASFGGTPQTATESVSVCWV